MSFLTDNNICKCCHGSGVQYNRITGLSVRCPCCGGSGKWSKKKKKLKYYIKN